MPIARAVRTASPTYMYDPSRESGMSISGLYQSDTERIDLHIQWRLSSF